MNARTISPSASSTALGTGRPGVRVVATLVVLAGLLTGALWAHGAGAQPAPEADIQIRVHSCPDDLDAVGFFQHLTQCTSERGLYGVALGVQTGALGAPQFQYSQPDGAGRANLMIWDNIEAGNITITEAAPDPIRPSVAFCSLQPDRGPLTMDGEEVPVNNGVVAISLDVGDTLMCDWYRFPGGVTAGDEGDDGGDDQGNGDGGGGQDDGDDGGEDDDAGAGAVEGVIYDPDGGDGGNPDLTGSQIFIQKWTCIDGEQIDGRPEILNTSSADGLAELQDACDLATESYQFTLGDVIAEGDQQPEGAAEDDQVADDGDGDEPEFQGIVAEDGTIVDEEGGPDEAVAGGPSGEGNDAVNQGIVADDEAADEDGGADDQPQNDGAAGEGEGAVGVYPPLEIGGIAEYEGWNGLAAGTYTILESLPEGYDQPLVLCDGIFAGAQAGANIFELTALDGAVTYDLSEGELLLCSWFNVQQDGAEVGDEDEEAEDQDGDDDSANNDRDRDGLLNTEETDLYNTDPDDEDTDDDGVVDGDEYLAGTNPNSPDTDGDTFTDSEEMYQLGTDPLVYDLGPLDDNDGDFLLNGEEVHEYGTDPFRSDSDMDGLSDYLEVVTYGSDPWVEDTDGDGYKDAVEADAGTDPTVPDR